MFRKNPCARCANRAFIYRAKIAFTYKRLDYGPADFDHRNVTALSYMYTIPKFLNEAPRVARYIPNDWSTTGLFEYRSGDPLTIWPGQSDYSGSGQKRDRAV